MNMADRIPNSKNGPCRRVPHNKLHDPNGNGQEMSQGFTTPHGRRQQLFRNPAEVRQAQDGQTISTN